MKSYIMFAFLLGLTLPAIAGDVAVPTGSSGRTPARDEIGINVKDAGAKCDIATDDTVAIQAAANTVPVGSTLIFPGPTACKINGTITITTSPITIRGPGTINQACATCDTFDLKSSAGSQSASTAFFVHDLIITDVSGGGASAGWAINFTNGTNINNYSRISNVQINQTFNGILLYDTSRYAIYGNYLNARATNIKQQPVDTPASVESRIADNLFGCSGGSCATHIEFAGGSQSVEVTGNKFLGGTTGIGFSGTVTGSGLVITGNEFENMSGATIDLGCGTGTTSFGSVVITGNHFGANTGTPVIAIGHAGQSSATCPGNVIISGNEIGVPGANGLLIAAGSTLTITGNLITGGTNGINLAGLPGGTNMIGPNIITSTTPYAGAGANYGSVILISLANGFTNAALPPAANGSQIYCSDCLLLVGPAGCGGGGTGSMAFRLNGAWACL